MLTVTKDGNETITGTVKEIATLMGVDRAAADGLIKLLVKSGVATTGGTQKAGKGKPSVIYVLPSKIVLTNE